MLDPYFSATKIEWLLRNVDGLAERARDGRAVFGTVDSWLLFKLTGEHVTEPSNAARTLLLDIGKGAWDPELLELFGGIPERSLPELRPSCGELGRTRAEDFHGFEVPVSGVAGDQQAALFGQRCLEPGLGKNTYGTGSFVLANAGTSVPPAEEGLLATIAWQIGRSTTYAHEAAIFVTGAAVQWLRDGLGIIDEAAETEALAASLDSNDGVYFVPALTGLGSPHWDPYARGTIVGLTRGSGRAHLARAALEAMAYQTVDAVRAMDRTGREPLAELRADGAATVNRWLMQFQADVLGDPGRRGRGRGDDGVRRGAARGRRRGPAHARPRWPSWATSAPATSRACPTTSASRCWTAGTARSSVAAGGRGKAKVRFSWRSSRRRPRTSRR